MRAIYEDNGSGKLTGRHLQELAAQLPLEAEIISLKVEESQTDGWYWSIKARVPEVPKPKIHTHRPGMRGSVADQVGRDR
jgi:hypothetical protein